MATPKNRSVMKAFSLLRSFRRADEWLTSSELSRRADLPEASGYRLVQTLEGLGAVVRDGRGRYRPGMLLVSLSQDISADDIWGKATQKLLGGLAVEHDIAIQVGVLEDGMVNYVARAGRMRPGLAIGVGTQLEAYCTALGKVLLSTLAAPAIDSYLLDGAFVPLTARTLIDPHRLRAELHRIRLEQVAHDDREMLDNVGCIAMPIYHPAGHVAAAISISQDIDRMTPTHKAQLVEVLHVAIATIRQRLYPWGVMPAPGMPAMLAKPGDGCRASM